MEKMSKVLFLCTGNYYRSRLAEIYFNHHAEAEKLNWRAESRGLNIRPGINPGPISPYTLQWLKTENITLPEIMRMPQPVQEADFWTAQHVIAVKEAEHRPLMEANFPHWAQKVEYWTIHDLDAADPLDAIPELIRAVDRLRTNL
jgi:protein-tyrosine phosphatase